MLNKKHKSNKTDPAHCKHLKDKARDMTGCEILKSAQGLYDAWRQENLETILDRSAETVHAILAGLKMLGLDPDHLFARMATVVKSPNGCHSNQRARISEDAIPGMRDAPSFLFTPNNAAQMVDLIKKEMIASDRVWVASAFYSPGVINLLISSFTRFTETGGELKVLTSTMGNFNRPDYLVHLRDTVPGIRVRVYHPRNIPFDKAPPPFHPKAWLFRHRDGTGAILIGSSNFTEAGFLKNVEWNYFSAGEVNIHFEQTSPFEDAISEFTRHWDLESVEISDEFLSAYRNRWQMPYDRRQDVFDPPAENWSTASGGVNPSETAVTPNPAQIEALVSLSRMRGQGIKKASVIAATGVGKTHLAAFDYKESGLENMLFIAHRENILLKARETFQSVLKDDVFGELLGAGREVQNGSGAVFAMIQTLSRPEQLERFSPDHFEYLVVDEFHHGMAPTYLKAIDYFKPRFMLCLTATPERMDGRDVLRLCDYNVAYEVRLLDAVDRGWLCPFQYFAVYDETDYRQIAWRGAHYDDEELTKALSSDTRTAIVSANLKKYLPSTGKTKALAFCSSVSHARYTAERLTLDHGIESLALSGSDPGDIRTAALARLENENDPLRVLCTVNIFNEGVDIPGLTHVLFLRPTQSFTVFLQQLGRGLRNAPGKEYLVVIDFVGNFKKAHVAPLALSGYTSVQEFVVDGVAAFRSDGSGFTLPKGCFLDTDLDVKRIWDREIRNILDGNISVEERLRALYADIRSDLDGTSPFLTDFLDNAFRMDPYVFIRHFGSWLRTKLECEGHLDPKEQALLDTPGEAFLGHLESGLSPVKSYKMVVLTCLLEMKETIWDVEAIATAFRGFFLVHRDKLFDYDDLAGSKDPEDFPISKVTTKLLQMPLKYLSNTDTDWFILDKNRGTFALKPEVVPYWNDPFFRELVADRVKFAMVRYFSRKARIAKVLFSEDIFKSGFPVDRDFALDFYAERPLKTGESRKVKLKVNGGIYAVSFQRAASGREYKIGYEPENEVIQAFREYLGNRFKSGETAFTLKVSGKHDLAVEAFLECVDMGGRVRKP